MSSQRRMNKGAEAMKRYRVTETRPRPGTPAIQVENKNEKSGLTEQGEPNGLARRGWRQRQITFWTPPIPPATGIGLSAGSGWFGLALATENVEPGFVWPSVVLIGMGMAYDLGRRALDKLN
nr:hypothetical protein [Streptomyces chartreusis]